MADGAILDCRKLEVGKSTAMRFRNREQSYAEKSTVLYEDFT